MTSPLPEHAPERAGTEDLATRRKRLVFQSGHRGIKEADILLSHFAASHLDQLTPEQLDRYETLLEEQDIDLVAWIGKLRPAPEHLQTDVLALLQTLNYVNLPR